MLLSLKNLTSFDIEAVDGNMGRVSTFFFDEINWFIRYLVVDTGKWLSGRKVLIAPNAIGTPKIEEYLLPVNLTRDQVQASPDIVTDLPVSRQKEIELFKHYNWSAYWGEMTSPANESCRPVTPMKGNAQQEILPLNEVKESDDPSLRDIRKVNGYTIHAKDDEIGHIYDFIVDTEKWIIRYLIVDTRKLLPGKKVIIPPDWIKEISWVDSEVSVDVNKDAVKNSPEYNPESPINREYEIKIYEYYGRHGYWV